MTLAGLVPRCGWGQVCGLVMMACGGLTDQDGQPRIELSEISSLLVGDSAQVTARLLAADGTPVPAAALRYTSNDPAVLSVDSTGFLRARNVGHADLVVQAAAFAEAVATRSITVRPLLVVDSIRPLEVAFGGLLHLYGVGLEPNPFAIVTVDGTPAPVHDYLPANPAAPNRGGILTIVVPAPAGPRASVGIVGDRGTGAFFGPITVIQQSIFEPNDLRPADLGVVPSGGFIYPLAFTREGAPAWYTFDNPVLQDVTIGVTVAPPIDVTWTLLFDTDVRRAEGDTECPNRR